MSGDHALIFSPGIWLGQGTIGFAASEDKLKFYTRWVVNESGDEDITGLQMVEISEVGQTVRNHYRFFDLTADSFQVELKNEVVGEALGRGVIDAQRIAWEFRCPSIGFEGYEVYELVEDQRYRHHAEYASQDQMRSIIDGHVWLKTEEKKS